MNRRHKIIFFLIALLALGTFVFGILQLMGAHRAESAVPVGSSTNGVNH